MKNLILSFAVACVAIVACTNQSLAQDKPTFGMKAGLTVFTLGTATSQGITASYDMRPGFQAGFYAELPAAENILFVPQVLYTQKGGNATVTVSGVTATAKTQVNYLDVPLLAGFKVQPNFTLYAGPQVAFLLSQTTTAVVSNGGSVSASSTDGLRKSIFGGNIGAGYKFNNRVGANLHYMFDFSHAADEANDTGERNSGFAITLGYSF